MTNRGNQISDFKCMPNSAVKVKHLNYCFYIPIINPIKQLGNGTIFLKYSELFATLTTKDMVNCTLISSPTPNKGNAD